MKDVIAEAMKRSRNDQGDQFSFYVLPYIYDASGEKKIANLQREPAWMSLSYDLQQLGFTASEFSTKLISIFGKTNNLSILNEIKDLAEKKEIPKFFDIFSRYPELDSNYSKMPDGEYLFAVGDPEFYILHGLLRTALEVRRENELEQSRKHERRLSTQNTIITALVTLSTAILIAIPSCINNEYEGLETAIGDTNTELEELQNVIQDKEVAGELTISNEVLSVDLMTDVSQPADDPGTS